MVWQTLSGRPRLSLDEELRLEASREGFGFIDRLAAEWQDGANRFDGPGEMFLGVFEKGGAMVAVGGLNRDFAYPSGVGRLRHLYVRRAFRGQGIASALVERLEAHAKETFRTIRLRTDTADAARFYTKRGYEPVDSETATHVLRLSGID